MHLFLELNSKKSARIATYKIYQEKVPIMKRGLIVGSLLFAFVWAACGGDTDYGPDSDGDGIADRLELQGYVYDWTRQEFRAWKGDIKEAYCKSDPFRVSTDQDPYPDGTEASGYNMDVSVAAPGNLPMVPAYPNIVVTLEGYEVTLNEDITFSEGETLTKGNNWSRQTELTYSHTDERSWSRSLEVGASFSLSDPFGISIKASVTEGGSTSDTNTYSTARTTGGTEQNSRTWSRARSINPTVAARVKLFLKVYNAGTAAASNVIPTLTLKIGGRNIATFQPGNAQINMIEPNATYPATPGVYWVVDTIDTGVSVMPISLTLDELRALETGAPVSVFMTQMLASVMSQNEDAHWESVGDWANYMARCQAVSASLFLDLGDGNIIHSLVYADDGPTAPRVTLADALLWVASGYQDQQQDELKIRYRDRTTNSIKDTGIENWTFALDAATLLANGVNRDDQGNFQFPDDYNLFSAALGPESIVIAKAPLAESASSGTVHYAYVDLLRRQVFALISDYYGIKKVEIQTAESGPVIELSQVWENAGYYQGTLPPEYDWAADEVLQITNLHDETMSFSPVELLYDGPIDVITQPEIRWVRLDHNELTLTAEVHPQSAVPIKKVYLVLLETGQPLDEIQMTEVENNLWYCRLPAGYHTAQFRELVVAENERGHTASSAVTDRVEVYKTGNIELTYEHDFSANAQWYLTAYGFDTTQLKLLPRFHSPSGKTAPIPQSAARGPDWGTVYNPDWHLTFDFPGGWEGLYYYRGCVANANVHWSSPTDSLVPTRGLEIDPGSFNGLTRSALQIMEPVMYRAETNQSGFPRTYSPCGAVEFYSTHGCSCSAEASLVGQAVVMYAAPYFVKARVVSARSWGASFVGHDGAGNLTGYANWPAAVTIQYVIFKPASDPVILPGLQVTEPSENQEIPAGSSLTINWTSTGPVQNVHIDLLGYHTDPWADLTTVLDIAHDLSNQGSYTWENIPQIDPASPRYRLRISDADHPEQAFDFSDFVLSQSPP